MFAGLPNQSPPLTMMQPNTLKAGYEAKLYLSEEPNISKTIIYSKMDKQYIDILHAPELEIAL